MPAPHPTLNHAARAFARRYGVPIDVPLDHAVRELERRLMRLAEGQRARQNWRTLCSRYRGRYGPERAPYVSRRPTFADHWLAEQGFRAGDHITPQQELQLRRELDRTWLRYHRMGAPPCDLYWRHRRGAEFAVYLRTFAKKSGAQVGVVRVIRRAAVVPENVPMDTNIRPRGATCGPRRGTRPDRRQRANRRQQNDL